MLSGYAKTEWTVAVIVGGLLVLSAVLLGWWWALPVVALATLGVLLFFRALPRRGE